MFKPINFKRFFALLVLMLLLCVIVNWNHIVYCFQDGYMSVRLLTDRDIEVLLNGLEEVPVSSGIYFNQHNLAYDQSNGVYYVTQNMKDHIWDGIFTSSDGDLYWKEDVYFDQYDEAIRSGHIFSLYCVNLENSSYSVYSIVFTGMPTMVITTPSGIAIGDAPEYGKMWVSDMKFAGKEYQSSDCTVYIRGQISRGYEKKGYKLELAQDLSLLGMRQDDDWILSSLYDDDGLIHNKFSYDVWRDIASSNSVAKDDGTTMEYVELFCNNTYLGVYGLIERIDDQELALNNSDILYKCGGYIEPNETIADDFGLSVYYDIKWPKEYDRNTWIPIKDYLKLFVSDSVTDYDAAKASLNMENAIDYNIFMILARACDNYYCKNTFFVAEYNNSADGYSIIKIPWDCNATWGDGLYKGNIDRQLYNPDWIYCAYVWSYDIKAMYQCYPDEIQELMLSRWRELRQEILSEERLFKMLDDDFAYLHDSGAYDRNYVRWNEHGREHWKDEYIYEYVSGRLSFLDTYFTDIYFDEFPKTEIEM